MKLTQELKDLAKYARVIKHHTLTEVNEITIEEATALIEASKSKTIKPFYTSNEYETVIQIEPYIFISYIRDNITNAHKKMNAFIKDRLNNPPIDGTNPF